MIPVKKLVIMTIIGAIVTVTLEKLGIYDKIARML
jgi:hypothetical protein